VSRLGIQIPGLPERLGGAIGWERTFEGNVCANEENGPKDTRVGSVSRGEYDVLN